MTECDIDLCMTSAHRHTSTVSLSPRPDELDAMRFCASEQRLPFSTWAVMVLMREVDRVRREAGEAA